MHAPYPLPERADAAPSAALLAYLCAHRDQPITLVPEGARRIDARFLALLLPAAQDWRQRGLSLSLAGLSAPQIRGLEALGVSQDLLTYEAQA